jgi:general secretion pathway protein E
VQINPKAGVTFASCLRAILRQDPDVIMVGEIRDKETAEIAFHAALTGHMVLSTLHTNSSIGAITRLIELGVKPTMVSAATNLIMAQRLARRICTQCREPYTPAAETLRKLQLDADSWTFQHGRGCEACGYSGYAGRVGIYEILRLSTGLKEAVNRGASERKLRGLTTSEGLKYLLDDGLAKVKEGLTTIEELVRIMRIEPEDFASWEARKVRVLTGADKFLPIAGRRTVKSRKTGRPPARPLSIARRLGPG